MASGPYDPDHDMFGARDSALSTEVSVPVSKAVADRAALAVVLNYLTHMFERGTPDPQLAAATRQLQDDLARE